MKRMIAAIVVFPLTILFLQTVLAKAENTEMNGKCGDDLYWRIEKNTKPIYEDNEYQMEQNTLFIEGTGAMYDYDYQESPAPWYGYLEEHEIDMIVFSDGVTSVGDDAFVGFSALESVTFCDTITEIGKMAFYYCGVAASEGTSFSTFPSALVTIGDGAFLCCNFNSDHLELSDNVETIGDFAFADFVARSEAPDFWFCTNTLHEVILPVGIKSIGEKAFSATAAATASAHGEDINTSEFINKVMMSDVIHPSYFTDVFPFTIKGYSNTPAELYADAHDFTFIALDEPEAPTESTTEPTSETTFEETSAAETTASTTNNTNTTPTTSNTTIVSSGTSSPNTGEGGIAAVLVTGVTALLGGLVCRKKK